MYEWQLFNQEMVLPLLAVFIIGIIIGATATAFAANDDDMIQRTIAVVFGVILGAAAHALFLL